MLGRVGNNQLTRKLLFHLKGHLGSQEDIFEQITTRKKILRPSDDPVGTNKSLMLHSQMDRLKQYESTITTGSAWTNASFVALDSASNIWTRISEIATTANDTAKSKEDLIKLAEELEVHINTLVATANTPHAGRYLFSGTHTDRPAFEATQDPNTKFIQSVAYKGNDEVRTTKTKDQGTLEVGLLGSNGGNPDQKGVFIDSNQNLNAFDTAIRLREKLQNNDRNALSGPGSILEEVEAVARNLAASQARLGGAQEVLQLDKNNLVEQNAELEKFLSEIEDADIAELILEYNNVQNVYEAALAVGGRLMQRGLLNFL